MKEKSFHPELSAATAAKTAASWRNVLKATQRLLAHAPPCIRHTPTPYVQTHTHTNTVAHTAMASLLLNCLHGYIYMSMCLHVINKIYCTFTQVLHFNRLQFWGPGAQLFLVLYILLLLLFLYIAWRKKKSECFSPLNLPLNSLQIWICKKKRDIIPYLSKICFFKTSSSVIQQIYTVTLLRNIFWGGTFVLITRSNTILVEKV